MKKLAALSSLFCLFLAVSCSSPAAPTADGDATDTIGNPDLKLDTAELPGDGTGETGIDTKQNECVVGEINCVSDTKYAECLFKDGFWIWGEAKFCDGSNVCACKALDETTCKPDGDVCVCIPACDGKECGPDGCGGDCGTCPENEFCDNGTGLCDATCPNEQCLEGETRCNGPKIQNCTNVFDGVADAEACWLFLESEDCPADMTCELNEDAVEACVCVNVACGEGCCGASEVCFGDSCCTPDCDGKDCGSDGCGGSCGDCQTGEGCLNGTCVVGCTSECNEGQSTCDGTTGFRACVEQEGFPGCWRYDSIAKPCVGNEKCDAGTGKCKCIPNCTGKECGDNGCGGSCGACTSPDECNDVGKCVCECSEWDGVTGWDVCGSDKKNYPNPCEAKCAGIMTYEKGKCVECPCTLAEKKAQLYCGIDNLTYPNYCELKCKIGSEPCKTGGADNCPEVKYVGECKIATCQDCSTKYEPVCGSNGATFWNKCYLSKCPPTPPPAVTQACQGECTDKTACPNCPTSCAPVCGLLYGQEITFQNECAMTCKGAELLYNAPCCNCAGTQEQWVCVGNSTAGFQAFENMCMFTCLASNLPFLYNVPLYSDGSPQLSVCEDCKCQLTQQNYAPVCGKDYQTYHNQCALNCLKQEVACDSECNAEDCPCPIETGGLVNEEYLGVGADPKDDGKRGVCGADGFTYGNACSAAYHGTIVSNEIWCEDCKIECGTEPFKPYCCEDRVTYPNLCIAQKCNDNLDPALCQKGKCCYENADCNDGNAATEDVCNGTGVCENNI